VVRISRVVALVALALGSCVAGVGPAGAGPRTVKAFGLVTSVNGSTVDGACGVAGTSGIFTIVSRNTSQTTIAVTSSTKFTGRRLSSPTFANVCVNESVGSTGTVVGGAFDASLVKIWSPKVPRTGSAFGLVTSVNGSTTTGICGAAGSSGTFTLMNPRRAQATINVTSSTVFFERGASAPTFANVCVNEMVGATGTASAGSIAATDVMIWSLVPTDFNAFGLVSSVNGSTAAGACGVAGTSGMFTVVRGRNAIQTTIDVTPATTFKENEVASPSFANVCVGEAAGAHGSFSGGVLNATRVHIWSPPEQPPATAFGLVISVNGSSASGACGVAGTAGTFTVIRRNASQAVIDVTSTTKFRDRGVTSPSFADLCVNETARAVGTLSAAVLNANVVHIFAAPPTG
jgi:hypothetical protein